MAINHRLIFATILIISLGASRQALALECKEPISCQQGCNEMYAGNSAEDLAIDIPDCLARHCDTGGYFGIGSAAKYEQCLKWQAEDAAKAAQQEVHLVPVEPTPEPVTVPQLQVNHGCQGVSPGDSEWAECTGAPLNTAPTDKRTVSPTGVVDYGIIFHVSPGETIATNAKETKTVELDDGSRFVLLTNSTFTAPTAQAPTTYTGLSGAIHFMFEKIKKGAKPKIIRCLNHAMTVLGTEFIVKADDNSGLLQVLEGTVAVSDDKNKTIKVEAGQQIAITKTGLGKLTAINEKNLDRRFNAVAPSSKFWPDSWQKNLSSEFYDLECSATIGQATATDSLTADEQKKLTAFNQAATKFKVEEIQSVDIANKKIFGHRQKTTIDGIKTATIYVSGNKILYGQLANNTWKGFSDPKMSATILNSARQNNLSSGLDQNSFIFANWTGVWGRWAAYVGYETTTGTDNLLNNIFGVSAESGQTPAKVTVYAGEQAKTWRQIITEATVKAGKLSFPLKQVCYVNPGGINIPKFKIVSQTTGAKELMTLLKATN